MDGSDSMKPLKPPMSLFLGAGLTVAAVAVCFLRQESAQREQSRAGMQPVFGDVSAPQVTPRDARAQTRAEDASGGVPTSSMNMPADRTGARDAESQAPAGGRTGPRAVTSGDIPRPEGSPEIRFIAGGAVSALHARMDALHALPTDLSPLDQRILAAYLLLPCPTNAGPQGEYVLRNDIMNCLRNQQEPVADLAETIMTVFWDTTQDVVLRDYAVQHLSALYTISDASQKQKMDEVFTASMTQTRESIAGTALMAMWRLSTRGGFGIPPDQIKAYAQRLCSEPGVSPPSRTAALQVGSMARMREILPYAIDAAHSGENLPLRLSAIAAVGSLGGRQQIAELTGLAQGSPAPISNAVALAVAALELRDRRGD